ncbi:MAG TPA: NUDIX domain-containing protein [Acidimicrobiales bacterium]|nr:NUDIX domain-containing protein [Acidimicrobiales bacterium]
MDPVELIAAITARTPVDERERRSIERFAVELARLERPFDEDADPVHVTASAIVIGHRGVVLHLHKRMQLWLQPGGHLDPGEHPAEAALREAIEETGLALHHATTPPMIAHVDAHDGPKGHFHLDVRYVLVADDPDADPAPPPDESQECRWFDWDEAVAASDAGLSGALRALGPRR